MNEDIDGLSGDELTAQMIAEIRQYTQVERIQKGDMTIQILMDEFGVSATSARRYGDKMVARGLWTRAKVLNDENYWITVYRQTDGQETL